MKFGKLLAVLAVTSVMLTAMSAKAQQMAWGTGMAMGQQSCPYNVSAGEGASSYLDDYNEVKKMKSDEEAKLREMKKKLRTLERNLDKNRQTIEDTLNSKYSSGVLAHMDSLRECSDYKFDEPMPPARPVKPMSLKPGDDDEEDLPPANNAQANLTPINGFTPSQWRQVCVQGQKGGINNSICSTSPYASSDRGRSTPNDCKKAIVNYRKDTVDYQKTQSDIERSEERIANYKEQLPELMRDAKQRYKEDRQAGTEGDICLTCLAGGSGYRSERSSPDWAGVAANVGVGLLATYMGYKTNKMVAQYNSDLGWPTQAYPAWGYGLPFLANGLYGALGGGTGSGAFGCAGGMGGGGFATGSMGGMGAFGMGNGMYGNVGMNGAFGYPMGMMGNPYGGGMFSGGMGPWGLGGMGGMGGMNPYGMGGMGYPMMGGGMYGNGMGMAISGGLGMAMGGGYPMMGGMYGNMGMGGMGYPMMGGMYGMDGGLGSMQMQQAMLQMQQQQQQLYMQHYQQQMQNQMARQQTMAGLQTELYNLMYRIQQVQMGYGSTGYISGGIGGGVSIGTGYGVLPAPGTSTTGSGVILAPGSSTTTPGGVVIPAGSR